MDQTSTSAPVPQAPAPAALAQPVPAFPRSAQIAMFCLLLLAAILLGANVLRSAPWKARPAELADERNQRFRVDLNHASKAELVQVTGIGEKKAEQILAYRAQQPFRSVDDLARIPGIGPATVRKLRPYLCIDAEENGPEEVSLVRRDPPAKIDTKRQGNGGATRTSSKKKPPAEPININTASQEELAKLPWIGQSRADDIIRERSKAPFRSVEDLTRVKGIKQGILERIRDYVTVGEQPSRVTRAE